MRYGEVSIDRDNRVRNKLEVGEITRYEVGHVANRGDIDQVIREADSNKAERKLDLEAPTLLAHRLRVPTGRKITDRPNDLGPWPWVRFIPLGFLMLYALPGPSGRKDRHMLSNVCKNKTGLNFVELIHYGHLTVGCKKIHQNAIPGRL